MKKSTIQCRNKYFAWLTVNYKYENHVLPSYKNFILPYKKTADLVINNDYDNLNGAKLTLEYILKESGVNNN